MCRIEHENVGAIARRADSDCEERPTGVSVRIKHDLTVVHRLVSYRKSHTTGPKSILKRPNPRRKEDQTRVPWLYLTIPMLPIEPMCQQ